MKQTLINYGLHTTEDCITDDSWSKEICSKVKMIKVQ